MNFQHCNNFDENISSIDCNNDCLNDSITAEEVLKVVKDLKLKKSAGCDGIINEMIRVSCGKLVKTYVLIFNLIFKSGIFPSIWRENIIKPIFKGGCFNDPSNYRGIALSSCLAYNAVCNKKKTSTVSDKSSAESDPDDSIPLINREKKKTEPCLEYTDLTDDSGEDDTYKPTKEDILENNSSTDFIKVALFSITGQEHYDAVEMMDTPNSTKRNSNKTPTRENISSPVSKRGSVITPRKRANYKSPVKKQLFRKMKSNPQAWKKNKRKHNRVHGLPYIGRTGKQQDQKTVKYRDCSRCRFRCSNKVSKEDAYKIFSTYYEMGSYEKQRAFLCQHVDQDNAKRTTTNRKENSNSYHLTVNEKREKLTLF
ncbi:unnamed protein product [Mytilus coruscus]|uniref:Reverse transcriptase domain-containing protein n=1 Tax=Mytilus coruscus TaxID=42192 RepID=A0A6J8CEC5_MYTCO|nr:unnamed protein product [Mytilus coruscus]